MTKLLSIDGIDIVQKNFQQILIRGDGKDHFNQIINKEISLDPPSKNLEIKTNDKYIFAKNSFDQWTLIYLKTHLYFHLILQNKLGHMSSQRQEFHHSSLS